MSTNNDFVEMYIKWVKDNMKSKALKTDLGEFIQISTPFLDRHNDHMQIYVKQEDRDFILSDAGYTINDLDMCGCDVMASPKRKSVLTMILNGFGVQLKEDEIFTRANYANFAQKKHALLQAMLSVNDMFFLSRPQVANVFLEDVQTFLDVHEIPYISNAQYNGASGLSHTFEFTIPASKRKPERFLRTINDVSRDKIDSTLFSWADIKDFRKPGAQLIVMLNDSDRAVKSDYINALSIYGATPIPWAGRENYIDELAC